MIAAISSVLSSSAAALRFSSRSDCGGTPACQPRIRLNFFIRARAELDPDWPNVVTTRNLDNLYGYEPGRYLADFAPTPLLMVVCVGMGFPAVISPRAPASGSHRHRRPREIGSQHIFERPLRPHVSADGRLIEVARHASRTVLRSYDAVSNKRVRQQYAWIMLRYRLFRDFGNME